MKMKYLRGLFVFLALAALLLLVLITLNLADFGLIQLERFREPILVFYACFVAYMISRKNSPSYIRDIIQTIRARLEHKYFFPCMAGIMLAFYIISSLTRHFAFQTCSHDFSIFDEALYNSHKGRFLFSPVLGKSFLAEHFSPILILLIPIHYAFTTPYLLILVQPVALWAAVLVLRKLLAKNGVSVLMQNLSCLIYLNHPISIQTLNYVFHMECFLPLTVFGLFWCYQNCPNWKYWSLLILALAVKEDVGVYLIGFAAYSLIYERKYAVGLITLAVSCAWVFVAVRIVIPYFDQHAEAYRFLSRWSHWGNNPQEILLGYLLHPLLLLKALFARPYLYFFASFLFVPFFHRAGWFFFIIPWVITSTSSASQQAGLALYYGVPLLTFAVVASIQAFSTPIFQRLARTSAAPYLAFVAVIVNVAHLSFPSVPSEKRAFLEQVHAIPQQASLQAMPCLYPALDYRTKRKPLQLQDPLSAKFVLIRTQSGTWPFTSRQAYQILLNAVSSGKYDIYWSTSDFYILHRTKSKS